MARPQFELDWSKLDAVLQYKATLDECADICGCSDETIRRKIKEKHGISFVDYRAKRMSNVKFTLIQKAIEMAKKGDRTMLIFSLKNLAGWSDKQDTEISGNISINIDKKDAEL